jgi:secretion/DNA translocation related TadE-like protein
MDRDRGAVTVLACVGAVVLLVVTGVAVHLGAVVLARQRAETGADLAALAGAAQLPRGSEVACAAAGVVARANGVTETDCRTDGLDLLVEVAAQVAGGGVFGGGAVGRARAGPVASIQGSR